MSTHSDLRLWTHLTWRVARYIANQEEHHRKRTYPEEYELFSGMVWNSALRKPLKWLPLNVGADPQPEGWGE
jgi:hypothetical protein